MKSFLDYFLIDNTSLFMGISSCFLFILGLVNTFVLIYKRYNKNKDLSKIKDSDKEYKSSQLINLFLGSITLLFLGVIKYDYFLSLDDTLNSLWILFAIILMNIVFKTCLIFAKIKEKYTPIKNTFLRLVDNFVMAITITLGSSIIASQIPIVEISKFFGTEISRFDLINLPFLLITSFIISSSISLLLQSFFIRFSDDTRTNINDFLNTIIPILITLIITIFYPLSYNMLMVISIGVLSKYILEKVSTFINNRKLLGKKTTPILKMLYPISNILFSSFFDIAVITILVFSCLNYAGFYGITITSLGLISSFILTSNINIYEHKSEVYKYIAKTINNIALFYIFFETLEFIYKTQININIFSDNVIIGLFTSIVFTIFNTLKIINLIKYVNMQTSRIYIAIRTLLYIILFTACISYLLPYINYELLGSLVLGLILITSFISVLLNNAIEVYSLQNNKDIVVCTTLKNSVLPLTNQITTILIIITILLLPIIK